MKFSSLCLVVALMHCAGASQIVAGPPSPKTEAHRKNPIVAGLSGAVAAFLAPVRITTEAASYVSEAANTVSKRMYRSVRFDPESGDFSKVVYIGGYAVPLVMASLWAYKQRNKDLRWLFLPALIAAAGGYEAVVGFEH